MTVDAGRATHGAFWAQIMNPTWLQKLAEVAGAFLKLGLTSFGGPVAHLGYFRTEFVEKRRWIDDQAYADVVALCQMLPGPASSQVVFCLGMRRAGIAGALLASLCFTLPSAVAMILFAYGVAGRGAVSGSGWLHGLKLCAVSVVGLAVWGMGTKLCPDWPRRLVALAVSATVLLAPGSWIQLAAMAACALAGSWIFADRQPAPRADPALGAGHAWAAASLLTFGVLLVGLPLIARSNASRTVAVVDGFYRAGSMVFGGGHVVLPLLRAEVVPKGWIGDDAFMAGYGAAQAVPGPLFTFAGYLGTVIQGPPHAWAGGVLALLAIFLPAWLLAGGALPFWHSLRGMGRAQGTLAGANAAVVGILLAAFCRPVCTEAIRGPWDVLAAAVAALALARLKAPAWLMVVLMAAAGQWVLR